MRFERDFHRLFAHHRLIREAHAISGQHAGIGMDEHRLHAQRIGHQARVLSAGAAEALQGEACRVVPLLHRHLLDRIRHVGDRDLQETFRHLMRRALLSGCLRDLLARAANFVVTTSASSG